MERRTSSAEGQDWKVRALCRNENPEIFFGPDGENKTPKASREVTAKAICGRCPVLEDCRRAVLASESNLPGKAPLYGIVAGLNGEERRMLINNQPAPIKNQAAVSK